MLNAEELRQKQIAEVEEALRENLAERERLEQHHRALLNGAAPSTPRRVSAPFSVVLPNAERKSHREILEEILREKHMAKTGVIFAEAMRRGFYTNSKNPRRIVDQTLRDMTKGKDPKVKLVSAGKFRWVGDKQEPQA